MDSLTQARYPIGTFTPPSVISPEDRASAIAVIAGLPEYLTEAVLGLTDEQLATPYRDGGWTVRQVVHHVADSHSIAMFRFKKALTEDWPTLPGYPEDKFAQLADVATPIEWSLTLLKGIHKRWEALLHSFDEAQWKRGFVHAERGKMALDFVTLNYAWHSAHHTAHITGLRARKGW